MSEVKVEGSKVNPIDSKFDLVQLTTKYHTKSSIIRFLTSKGYTRSNIAKFMGIRYQHVRNVQLQPLKKG